MQRLDANRFDGMTQGPEHHAPKSVPHARLGSEQQQKMGVAAFNRGTRGGCSCQQRHTPQKRRAKV
jgi:hypothetical protein